MINTYLLLLLALLAPTAVNEPATAKFVDRFESESLAPAWTASIVLSQGPGAKPGYSIAQGRLIWSYATGTSAAQQQVLLRSDVLPSPGDAVEVRLSLDDLPPKANDFAGLAISAAGPAPADRTGMLLFFLEPATGRLQFWHFGNGPEEASARQSATPDLAAAKTLTLRLVRIGEQHFRAAWSTDGQPFQWLPALRYGPVAAIGVYNGNSRNPQGNRLSLDDFQVVPCAIPDRPEDYAPSTPRWTPPSEFLAAEGTGGATGWPQVRPEARPGAYWWWPASAVTKEDLTWNLETYRRAGWGNMGVIGIYGVRGEEDRFIDIFSPKWFEMFNHALAEAKRLGMNIDLTPSSGWRMGGPHVTPEYGEQNFAVEGGRIVAKPNPAKVKRAGPGGEGLTINPYSEAAVAFHLKWIEERFAAGGGSFPRAFYYDSFENPGNWCPELVDAFRRLRGYALEEHAEALAGRGDPETARRVVCDYRETLSDLLIARVEEIVRWGSERGSGLRMQAHGSPANLLDMYAAAAIPETEVFGASQFAIPGFRREEQWIRPDRQSDLVNRFASSAAHVAGRELTISESFTWLRNHYHTALSQIKAEADKLLLNGINCIYYHGICFSPEKTAWPGWLFYASTQANARNSIFRDIPALNASITRSQSVLQEGAPANDVLLYWPVYDLWMGGGTGERRFTVHHPDWIDTSPCGEAGRWMIAGGYTFDYISDRQLQTVNYGNGRLRSAGKAEYRTVLLPAARVIKTDTLARLLSLAEAGATVLVWKALPQDVPGWHEHAERKQALDELVRRLSFTESAGENGPAPLAATIGKGKVVLGDDLEKLLEAAAVTPEPMVDHGLEFIRRQSPSHVSYFVANHTAEAVDAWVPLAAPCRSVLIMDPMTARTGLAPLRTAGGQAEIYLQMQPGETRILRAFSQSVIDAPAWPVKQPAGNPVPLAGTWQVEFIEGGPNLPKARTIGELKSWTEFGDEEADRFAGAARYTIRVDRPAADAAGWWLDLGEVRETARVRVNGKAAGIAVAHPFRVDLERLLAPGRNEISIEVTNLSANRIRDLDNRGVDWKKFYDTNLVDQMYHPFDASKWDLEPSGLIGPVELIPYRLVAPDALPPSSSEPARPRPTN